MITTHARDNCRNNKDKFINVDLWQQSYSTSAKRLSRRIHFEHIHGQSTNTTLTFSSDRALLWLCWHY